MKFWCLIFLFSVSVLASDEDERESDSDFLVDTNVLTDVITDVDTSVITGDATTTVEGNSTRAYGISLGGVEINQCYRSYQVLLWQDSKVNPLCLADSYDQKGLHLMAAIIRCDVRLISKHFRSDDECIDANTMQVREVPALPVPDLGELYDQAAQFDAHFEHDVQQEQQLEQIKYQLEEQQAQLAQWQRSAERSAAYTQEAKLYARDELERLKGYLGSE